MEVSSKGSALATFFNNQRELIEAAETPFAKLAVFVLPILAPLVPAFMTGTHLYKLFLEIFGNLPTQVSFLMALIIGIVFELLGYVGAINFIKSMFTYIQNKLDEYLLPLGMNFLAYLFYLISMFVINIQLSDYFGVASIITNIVGVLSFVTVPTSLLAATHLNEIAESERKAKEESSRVHLETSSAEAERNFKLEKYRIKYGKVSGTHSESSNEDGNNVESSKKVPDWRKMLPTLSPEDLSRLAHLTPDQMRTYAADTNYTYKTISNWRQNARKHLGIDSGSN